MSAEQQKTKFSRVWKYATNYKLIMFISVLGVMLDALVQGAFALMLEPLLDDVFTKHNAYYIKIIPWVIIAMFFVRGVGHFIGTYGMSWVGRKIIADIRQQD